MDRSMDVGSLVGSVRCHLLFQHKRGELLSGKGWQLNIFLHIPLLKVTSTLCLPVSAPLLTLQLFQIISLHSLNGVNPPLLFFLLNFAYRSLFIYTMAL